MDGMDKLLGTFDKDFTGLSFVNLVDLTHFTGIAAIRKDTEKLWKNLTRGFPKFSKNESGRLAYHYCRPRQ